MTAITLSPELENAVAFEASRKGTTVELLALDVLQERFLKLPAPKQLPEGATLADALADYIGAIDTSDKYPQSSTLSIDTGRKFGQTMVVKHKRGEL